MISRVCSFENENGLNGLFTLSVALAVVLITIAALSRTVSGDNALDLLAFGTVAAALGLARVRLDIRALVNAPQLRADAIVVIASAPFLGLLTWLPALLATLARLAGKDNDHSLRHTMAELTTSAVSGLIAGWLYVLISGRLAGPGAPVSLWGAASAAGAFSVLRFAPELLSHSGAERARSLGWFLSLVGGSGVIMALWMQTCPRSLITVTGWVLLLTYVIGRRARRESATSTQHTVAVQSESRQDDTTRPSMIDPLTGLANDRYLYMFLRQEIGRSSRKNLPLSLLIFNIDDFSHVNEHYGTETADNIIKGMAEVVRGLIRDYDLAARCSGDELVIVLPEAASSDAADTAERIRQRIASHRFLDNLGMMVSIGVASYPEHGTTPDNLMSSAHHALNRAKFSGKNRVVSCAEIVDNLKYGT